MCIDLWALFAVAGNALFRGEDDKRLDAIAVLGRHVYRLRIVPAAGSNFGGSKPGNPGHGIERANITGYAAASVRTSSR